MIRNALGLGTTWAQLPPPTSTPSSGAPPLRGACGRARAGPDYAAGGGGAGTPDVVVAAAMAKATSTEMFRFVAAETIQVHGGIGFTWEHDLRFYLKRAKDL